MDLSQHLSNQKSLELVRKPSIDGSPSLLVCCKHYLYFYRDQSLKISLLDFMIDFGFVCIRPSSSFLNVNKNLLFIFYHILKRFGNNHLRAVWRISLGLGAVPALAVFIWRLSMEQPARFGREKCPHSILAHISSLRGTVGCNFIDMVSISIHLPFECSSLM